MHYGLVAEKHETHERNLNSYYFLKEKLRTPVVKGLREAREKEKKRNWIFTAVGRRGQHKKA